MSLTQHIPLVTIETVLVHYLLRTGGEFPDVVTIYYSINFFYASGQTNDVFTITLSTTNLNRSVACTRLMPEQPGLFSCQFCIEINAAFICYDLENSASNSGANAALTDLGEGTYLYRVTASLNGVPVASISDVFSTGKYCLLVSSP